MNREGKKKILVIEDAKDYQLILKRALEGDYDLTMASNGTEAMACFQRDNFDLILLDVTLPDNDGYQVCSSFRSDEKKAHIPIIFVTSNEEKEDMLLAFSLGADDYVTKPFQIDLLKARITARLRQAPSSAQTLASVINRGDLVIDQDSRRVYIQREEERRIEIDITTREYNLLVYLAKNVDKVLSRDQVLISIWGDDINVTDRVVDAHVSRLRKKLRNCGEYIESVRGLGYRFNYQKAS